MIRTDDLDYELPEHLVAALPSDRRESARLLVLDSGGTVARHETISDLPQLLPAGALLVLNDTRVIPARFTGRHTDTGGAVSGLYVHSLPEPTDARVMLKSGRRLRPGLTLTLRAHDRTDSPFTIELIDRLGSDWHVRFHGGDTPMTALQHIGLAPLPPYILRKRARDHLDVADRTDRDRYQTVYARSPGAVAAPTAGLHFTPELLDAIRQRGITTTTLTLHVGPGTFKPVQSEFVEQHPIHAEHYAIPGSTIAALRAARAQKRPIIPVGTTSVRALESLPAHWQSIDHDLAASTQLLITPGFTFRFTDGLLTNFHLPRSTLLALVAARIGRAELMTAYRLAIAQRYRFYSYGDAMLIGPSPQ